MVTCEESSRDLRLDFAPRNEKRISRGEKHIVCICRSVRVSKSRSNALTPASRFNHQRLGPFVAEALMMPGKHDGKGGRNGAQEERIHFEQAGSSANGNLLPVAAAAVH